MPISSTIVIKELEYWFSKFLFTCELNKNSIPYPATINDELLEGDQSFIRLLFDDDWPSDYNTYYYKFKEVPFDSSWPNAIRNRLCIYQSAKLYECDLFDSDDSINFFNLEDDDFHMLDKLLEYRLADGTAIYDIEIDSTASVDTVLSTLIHNYLNLKINNNYQDFDNMETISNDLITSLYEVYVTEKMFGYISSKGS